MFALSEADLKLRILGCADGPASFNAEAAERRVEVVSVDPIYRLSSSEIRSCIDATFPEVMEQTRRHFSEFIWKEYATVEELGRARMASMERFLDDYHVGRECGRYLAAELPSLPFQDQTFELALCSHFLFVYSEQLSQEFHIASILEMCRVAKEVRVFPLITLGGAPSRHVIPVTESLQGHGFTVKTGPVEYEFRRGGNQMMQILPKAVLVDPSATLPVLGRRPR
jgi:hypothetical protein